MPRVSIVLPTYNRLRYLREAIASVLAQSLHDWELIVVDDGSTDDSRGYLAGLRDPRINVVLLEHSGNKSLVRNTGINRAGAEWIAFLDSDDVWLPRKLEVQLALLATHKEYVWSCTAVSFINAEGNPIPRQAGRDVPRSGWIVEDLLTFDTEATVPTLLVKKAALTETGAFDTSLMWREDYDLELRLAARYPILAVAEALTLVRHHDTRTSRGRRPADLHEGTARAMRKNAALLPSGRTARLARREAARQMAFRAALLSREGAHREAFDAIRSGFADAIGVPALWRTMIGCAVRAVGLRGTPTLEADVTGEATEREA